MSLVEILEYQPFLRALIASSMVGIICGVLGPFIVLRNMSLIGDALSHAVLPGIVVATILIGYNVAGFFIGSVLAGMLSAIIITWIQHKMPTKNDAAIGIIFTTMFALGVMGISRLGKNDSDDGSTHIDLKDILFGNVLGVSDQDLWLSAIILVFVLASVFIFYKQLFLSTFQETIAKAMGVNTKMLHYFIMLLLSFAVVSSMSSVGVILVVALLITPTSTALLLTNRLHKVVALSAIIGVLSTVIGMYLAIVWDTTPGPMMAVTAALFYLLAVITSPDHGLLNKMRKNWKMSNKIMEEDVLKSAIKMHAEINTSRLAEKIQTSKFKVKKALKRLRSKNLLNIGASGSISLTKTGRSTATKLVRAHRLWETYMVDKMGFSEDQIHNEAERTEHYMTNDFLEEVDASLGFPNTDPHGKTIPRSRHQQHQTGGLKIGSKIVISRDQEHPDAIEFLWESEINAEDEMIVQEIDNKTFGFKHEEGTKIIPQPLMSLIHYDVIS